MSSVTRNDAHFTLLDGDDERLLDWDGYASPQSKCMPTLPRWWYQLSTRQRQIARGLLAACGVLGLIVVISSSFAAPGSSSPPQAQGDIASAAATAPLVVHAKSTRGAPQTQAEPPPPALSALSHPELPIVGPPFAASAGLAPSPVETAGAPMDADLIPAAGASQEPAPAPAPAAAPAPASNPGQGPAPFPQCSWGSYRLPTNVKPFKYDVWLQLDAQLANANGTVRIALALASPAQCLVLHADRSITVAARPLDTADGPVPGALPPHPCASAANRSRGCVGWPRMREHIPADQLIALAR